jgi:hypothetical protein
MSPSALKKLGASQKTTSILYNNYHGWFFRVERGLYTVSSLGKAAYRENMRVVEVWLSEENQVPKNEGLKV